MAKNKNTGKPLKAYLTSKLYVPESYVDKDRLLKYFQIRLYDEPACNRCEFKVDRFSEVCGRCDAYMGKYILYDRKSIKGEKYIGFPLGRRDLIRKVAPKATKLQVVDKRSTAKRIIDVKMSRKLWGPQINAVKELLKRGYGLFIAPARSGKTIIAIQLILEYPYKTLILASQHDWLNQFMIVIYGGGKDEVAFTDAAAAEHMQPHPVARLCKEPWEFEQCDIALATYQTFLSPNGKKKLEKIRNSFGLVIIDEVDTANADEFSKVVSRINARHKYGLTATRTRKDGKHVIVDRIVGRIAHTAHIETLAPRLALHFTKRKYKGYQQFVYAIRALERDEVRNKMIAVQAVKDILEGRSIVIPVMLTGQVDTLVKEVNTRWKEATGKEAPVAIAFTGRDLPGSDIRIEKLTMAKTGKVRCVVGIRKIIYRGINVPRWDTIYEVSYTSNPPNVTQEISRIRTKVEGKKPPIIRQFLDDCGISKGCFRSNYYNNYRKEGVLIDKVTAKQASQYIKDGTSSFGDDWVATKRNGP